MNKPMTGVGSPLRKTPTPRPVFATIFLLDPSGKCNKKWLVQDSRVSIGSHRDCSIQLLSDEIEAVHAVLNFGRHHILLKAFGDDVMVDNRLVREWLFDQACDIQIASHTLRIVPQRDTSKQTASVKTSGSDSVSDKVEDTPSQPATAGSDLAAIQQLMETLILPLRQGLDDVKQQIGQTPASEPANTEARVPADEQAPNRLLDEIDRRIRSILQEQDGHLTAALSEFQNNLRVQDEEKQVQDRIPTLESIQTFAQKVEGGFAELRRELESIQKTQQQLLDAETINRRFAALEAHSESVEQSLREIQHELIMHSSNTIPPLAAVPVDTPERNEYQKLQRDLTELRSYSQQASSDLYDELIKLRKQIEARSYSDSMDTLRQGKELTQPQASLPTNPAVDYSSQDYNVPSYLPTGTQSHAQNDFSEQESEDIRPQYEETPVPHSEDATAELSHQAEPRVGRNPVSAQDIYARFKQEFLQDPVDPEPSHAAASTFGAEFETADEDKSPLPIRASQPFAPDAFDSQPIESPYPSKAIEETALNEHDRMVDFRDEHGYENEHEDEVVASAEIPSSEVDRYSSFRNATADETLSDEDESTESPKGHGTTPVNSHNTIDAIHAGVTTHGQHGEEEDSIESYMEQLLRRVRGDTSIINPSKSTESTNEAKRQETDERRQILHESLQTDTDKVPSLLPSETAEWEPFRARQIAPDKLPDITAMRELANSSTRSAINHSQRKRMVSTIYSKLIVSIVGFLSMFFLYSLNGMQVNIAMFGTVASLIVGCIWGWESISEWMKLRTGNKTPA